MDPGGGSGRTAAHDVELLPTLRALRSLGVPVVVGPSRTSVLGQLTGRALGDRLLAPMAAAVAARRGAAVLRVHDVAATRDVLAILDAVGTGRASGARRRWPRPEARCER